jgi:hypothetical protein
MNDDLPPLPNDLGYYFADDMRAYVLADRAARAAQQMPDPSDMPCAKCRKPDLCERRGECMDKAAAAPAQPAYSLSDVLGGIILKYGVPSEREKQMMRAVLAAAPAQPAEPKHDLSQAVWEAWHASAAPPATEQIDSLRAAVDEVMRHQFTHNREAMTALQELIDAADAVVLAAQEGK